MRGRKKIALLVVSVLVLVTLWILVLWLKRNHEASPLHGVFDQNLHCMGGHEIFLLLEEGNAYEYVPGHHEKRWLGSVARTESSVTITSGKTPRVIWKVDWDGKQHAGTIYQEQGDPSASFPIAQVTNPFRMEGVSYLAYAMDGISSAWSSVKDPVVRLISP